MEPSNFAFLIKSREWFDKIHAGEYNAENRNIKQK